MKIKVFTLFSIVFILLGCRDYNSLQPTSISSVTDFMKFTSSVDFKNQIDKLKTLSPEQLKKWNDSNVILSILDMKNDNYSTGGRVSVDSSQLALYDEMLDPIFASILNKNGEFSVGDLFIRITPDIVFMSTFDKIDKVRALDPFAFLNVQPNKTIIQDGIKIGRVYHERTSLAGGRTLFNGVDHTIYDWDDRHRSATVIYNDNWLIYKSIGCKVKFQNKRWWGGWWQDDTDA
ncbi:hypothetical protein BWI96_18845 [Siphonobacter sp. SORGH_AS_0500]|uniref:hypothetical protein n=1 Tax=Siphonobacter sp. SORGH_AS_0500 TaxID=1864824 RepID=UPI000CC327E0|nr:hypothetical protein [Siphonobacter sp. SORGH_AS_0500]PKK35112.1 hypothetical protein BWI96_18845 [Siphonobacter sp. SORGH_AS_0500]